MDAPAHLYNASLIKQIGFGHNAFLEAYIRFNPVFVPNWLCHLIMAPLMPFFSPAVTEKFLLLCFFLGLPVAGRYCLSAINKDQKYISLLIIPFTYNFLNMISFYNFSLGLVFMLLTIGFFYRNFFSTDLKWHRYIILLLLLFITYLCHIVVLGITILYLFFIYLWYLINTYDFLIKKWFSAKTIRLIVVIVPVVFLMGLYLKSIHSIKANYSFLSSQELFSYFKDGRLFTIYSSIEEQSHSNFMALFYLSAFFIALYLFVTNLSGLFYKKIDFYFLLAVLVMLVMYKLLPDGDGIAGYVSIRLSIIIFILAMLFISSANLENRYLMPLCVLIVFIHFQRLHYYKKVIKQTHTIAESIVEQSKSIEDNSFIVPFKYDDNWLSGHYSNYLGVNRSIICLENYECNTGYFPLAWKNRDEMWNIQQALYSFRNIDPIKNQLKNRPIYYWVLGNIDSKTDSISLKFKQDLVNNCLLINSTKFATLYKLK